MSIYNLEYVATFLFNMGYILFLQYQNDQNVLILLAPLCAILDTPQKAGLLIEIESLITDSDLSTYRHAVRKYQETLESRSNRSRTSSLYGSVHSELAPLSINPHSTLDDMYQRADSGKLLQHQNIDLYK